MVRHDTSNELPPVGKVVLGYIFRLRPGEYIPQWGIYAFYALGDRAQWTVFDDGAWQWADDEPGYWFDLPDMSDISDGGTNNERTDNPVP